MARFAYIAVFLVVCLYFATNEVRSEEATTSSCPDNLAVGEVKTYHPNCIRCECEEDGLSCKACHGGRKGKASPGCVMKRMEGDYPVCCNMVEVCN